MSTEPLTEGGPQAGAWRRFLAWVRAAEAAVDTTYDDLQDRRILALEREVGRLKAASEPAAKPPPAPGVDRA